MTVLVLSVQGHSLLGFEILASTNLGHLSKSGTWSCSGSNLNIFTPSVFSSCC